MTKMTYEVRYRKGEKNTKITAYSPKYIIITKPPKFYIRPTRKNDYLGFTTDNDWLPYGYKDLEVLCVNLKSRKAAEQWVKEFKLKQLLMENYE